MKFAHPLWLFGMLFALVVGGLLVLGALKGVRALRRFGDEQRVEGLLTARVGSRRAIKGALSVLSLAACFIALAQPQYGWGTRRIPATNLDVIVVLDYSKSMYARDVAPNRTERAKSEVARLISELAGARFGAVAFAGEPLSFPLTSDGGAIAQFFRQLTPHDMPVGGTAIARALEAGRSLLERDPQSNKHRRVMVLVTDGEDLEGDPEQTARSIKESGVSIFVVQIGGRTPEPIPDIDEQGVDRGLRRSEQGGVMTTALSAEGERQLTQIAEITGGNVVRSGGGATGIEEVTRRLRAMMTEELSERVETVYADVYAYPLGVALVLLALEAFVPEVQRRRRRKREDAKGVGSAPPNGAATPAPAPALSRAGVGLMLLGLSLVLPALGGCESRAIDPLFTRNAPSVDDAIEALEARDAGAAQKYLTGYLGIAPCQNGTIGATPALAERAQASFDLGLALFHIGERFGGRFGEDPGQAQDDARLLSQRSAEVACALSVVRELIGRPSLPIELRAQANYLLGNLEFLRREYEAAVTGYDRAIELIPGDAVGGKDAVEGKDAVDAKEHVGRDAAHNRAIALRLAKENEPEPPEPPDGGQPDPGDAGAPSDQPQPPSDESKEDREKPQDKPEDDPEKPSEQKDQEPDSQQEPEASKDQQPEPRPEGQDPSKEAPPPPEEGSLSQDEKMLDQLERAPTVQQEAARAQRGRARRVVEDK